MSVHCCALVGSSSWSVLLDPALRDGDGRIFAEINRRVFGPLARLHQSKSSSCHDDITMTRGQFAAANG